MMGHWTTTVSQPFFSIQYFLDVWGKWGCFWATQRGVCMKLFHLCFSHVPLLTYQFSLVCYMKNCITLFGRLIFLIIYFLFLYNFFIIIYFLLVKLVNYINYKAWNFVILVERGLNISPLLNLEAVASS